MRIDKLGLGIEIKDLEMRLRIEIEDQSENGITDQGMRMQIGDITEWGKGTGIGDSYGGFRLGIDWILEIMIEELD